MILYVKMVPHAIEGMMIGFAWGLIKFNFDVIGRLITVALNQKFMVMGEPMPEPGEVRCGRTFFAEMAEVAMGGAEANGHPTPEMALMGGHSPLFYFMNLYKIYLIQAGMVAFPVFFIWMLTKRARVEEVQMVLHHRHHQSQQHPDIKHVSIAQDLDRLRATKSVRLTVNNDFKQFVTLLKDAHTDVNAQIRMTQQLNNFEQAHISAAF